MFLEVHAIYHIKSLWKRGKRVVSNVSIIIAPTIGCPNRHLKLLIWERGENEEAMVLVFLNTLTLSWEWWLETLGETKTDWTKKTMSCIQSSCIVTLKGNSMGDQHHTIVLLQSYSQDNGIDGFLEMLGCKKGSDTALMIYLWGEGDSPFRGGINFVSNK